jgi:glycosyltransferase involved in cell wall biosynthesis
MTLGSEQPASILDDREPAVSRRSSVLMIAYAYPPISASGVIRTVSFAQRLPAFGWDPMVLTVRHPKDTDLGSGEPVPPDIPVFRTPEYNLQGFVEFLQGATNQLLTFVGSELRDRFYHDLMCIPDPQIAWFSSIRGVRLATRADVVYVSCSPFSSAISGVIIKRLTGRPLVLDFRDAWSLNPYNRPKGLHRAAIVKLERLAIAACDHLILNTPGALRLYRERYPEFAARMSVIPNGYNTLNVASLEDRPTDVFRIMHVGSFYRSRGPERLLEALRSIGQDNIEFVQVGPSAPVLVQAARHLRIRVINQVPHAEALRLMRTASLLYLKQGFEPGVTDYIAVAAKTYEYLATGLPILAEGPSGDNMDVVREHAPRSYIVTDADASSMERAVQTAYADRDAIQPGVTDGFVRTFDRNELTRQLAAVLSRVSASAQRASDGQM